jgi:hypothetical protein
MADPDREHTVTELAVRAGTSKPRCARSTGPNGPRLVVTRRLGNTRLVKANPANPLYAPYREIVMATDGLPAVILQELAGVTGIEHLYLFGAGAARHNSEAGPTPNDIDLLVVGRPDRNRAYDTAQRAEHHLTLPVQATIRTAKQRQDRSDPFTAEIRLPAIGLPPRRGARLT